MKTEDIEHLIEIFKKKSDNYFFESEYLAQDVFDNFKTMAFDGKLFDNQQEKKELFSKNCNRQKIIDDFFTFFKIKKNQRNYCIQTVLEELMMNAAKQSSQCSISAIREAPFILFQITDESGTLDKQTVLDHILKNIRQPMRPDLYSLSGAGLGLSMVYMNSLCTFIKVHKNKYTQITSLFRLDIGEVEKETIVPSIIFFSEGFN